MEVNKNISSNVQHKTLKDFIPLVFAFFLAMGILSLYQNLRLYFDGVLDGFLNKSLLLLLMHHTGFAALIALFLAFLFNFLEIKKANLGFLTTKVILAIFILIEGLLIEHYVQNYEALGFGMFNLTDVIRNINTLAPILITLFLTILLFHFIGRITRSFYTAVSRMYPFTIVLFSLFLATLNSDKKPINENKTKYFVQSIIDDVFDFNKYEGELEYPLLRPYSANFGLNEHISLAETKPNIVVLIIDGLGSDFIGEKAKYKGFTPFLEALSQKSLFWKNHLSNTGESFASLPTIVGSLPFGKEGFTNETNHINRQTLYSVLKENGYTTSFNYGGNSALNGLDRFLDEERVDEILDKKGFGQGYTLQEEDAAGITLGYPDKELFRKWNTLSKNKEKPRLDVFLSLSTKDPYLIPEFHVYKSKVDKLVAASELDKRTKKIINRNEEVFASFLYMDEAVKEFMDAHYKSSSFNNTIFLITGSHNVKDLPQDNNLDRYKVPLMLYSPLLKQPKKMGSLVSHADITPTIVSMLKENYGIKVPNQTAWLGDGLVNHTTFKKGKQIPLFRDRNNIQDYIYENHFVSNSEVHELDNNLVLSETNEEVQNVLAKSNFMNFKAINKYVTAYNKIMPPSEALYAGVSNEFSKSELVWVQSVFNGNDFDNAYKTARELAIDEDWDRALLLARYILSEIPRHADTEVLIGRIHSWKKDYSTSIQVLKEVIRKYPTYSDAYAAVLDAYYWADQSDEANSIFTSIKRNSIESKEIDKKVERAKNQIKKKTIDKATAKAKIESNMASINE